MLKTVWPYLLALLLGVAAGFGLEHLISARQIADMKAVAQKAQLEAVDAARAEERRHTAAQQEIAEDAAKQRDRARADAAAAASAADGLRKQVAVLVGRARHSAVTAGSAPTGDALDLLADVLGRTDARAGELARIADERGVAGRQCEADYDALTRITRTERPH
ncbi:MULTISPECIES: DUF2514 family protein [Burkholderia]|uniref:DUF2514 family protein n=1 Tax=Burkholderia TaxID=32008 RepID=UPI0008414E59|nr:MULTISPECIES: DUF2514 family protein [unclassified Burkholderia]AOK30299.1 hypothetical protein AQ611_13505 [Burkholderia sp. Bp7605]